MAKMTKRQTRMCQYVFEIASIAKRMELDGAIQVEDSMELFRAVLDWACKFDPQFIPGGGNHQNEIESYAERRLQESFPIKDPGALVCRHDNIFFMLPNGVQIKAVLCGDADRDQSDNGWSSIDVQAVYPDGGLETLCCADYEAEDSEFNTTRGKLRIFAYDGTSDEMAYECKNFKFPNKELTTE